MRSKKQTTVTLPTAGGVIREIREDDPEEIHSPELPYVLTHEESGRSFWCWGNTQSAMMLLEDKFRIEKLKENN